MKKFGLILSLALLGASGVWIYSQRPEKKGPAEKTELVVYAYSSFVASWGVGPEIQRLFESQTGMALRLVDVGDTALMVSKMDTEGVDSADVWVGLDRIRAEEAAIRFQWMDLPIADVRLMEPLTETDVQVGSLVAFNWAPLAFVYDRKKWTTPDLKKIFSGELEQKFTIPEPNLSPLGSELIRWLASSGSDGDPLDRLKDLKRAKPLFGKSWSQSYGLFQKGEMMATWSFLTSPVYHWVEEKNEDIQPLIMADGHPALIEFAGVPASSKKRDLAIKFMKLLRSSEVQKLLMNKNYMFPILDGLTEGTRFQDLPKVKLVTPLIEADAALALWNKVK